MCRFYKRLRHEITFQTTEALQRQMIQDREETLNYLETDITGSARHQANLFNLILMLF